MPPPPLRKPLLPGHYSIWCEPPDESGDEVLHIVSARRSLKLKGHSFREFHRRVVPLLDGRHTFEEVHRQTADLFRLEDLAEALTLLGEQGVLVEGDEADLGADVSARLAPQLNLFREMMPSAADAQARLAAATVAVVGLGGAGAATALALAAAGVGTLRCIDALPVAVTDIYLSPFFALEEVGRGRAVSLAGKVCTTAPQVQVSCNEQALESEADVRAAIAGAGFVVCCLDAAQSNLAYKLNRVCLADGVRWISCSLDGAEVTVGPTVHPGDSACYLCYRMRLVACAGNPEDAFALEKYLDRRKRDDSVRRENLVFGAGLAANLLGIEVLKELVGLGEPSLVGRILTVGLTDLNVQKHTVLRKPWCPACFPKGEVDHGG
jgi:molybdopterin-synthase adenylyltransferase